MSSGLPAGPSGPPLPTAKRLAAARDRFEVDADETIEAVVGPDHEDFRWNAGIIAGMILALGIADAITDLVAGGAIRWGVLGFVLLLAVGVGLLAGVMTMAGPPLLVATDRGIRLRDASDRPLLIPWDDVVDLEATVPFAAEYRIRLRPGAPALDRLGRSSWTSWKRDPQERIVGANSVWDVGGHGLDAIRDAMDRHAVRAFSKESSGAATDRGLPGSPRTLELDAPPLDEDDA